MVAKLKRKICFKAFASKSNVSQGNTIVLQENSKFLWANAKAFSPRPTIFPSPRTLRGSVKNQSTCTKDTLKMSLHIQYCCFSRMFLRITKWFNKDILRYFCIVGSSEIKNRTNGWSFFLLQYVCLDLLRDLMRNF